MELTFVVLVLVMVVVLNSFGISSCSLWWVISIVVSVMVGRNGYGGGRP